jgi:signal transduction histidine kinase
MKTTEKIDAVGLIADSIHTIRTPLVAVQGYTRMILEQRVGPLNATQQEYLQIVLENAHRMIQALNELSSQLLAAEMARPATEAEEDAARAGVPPLSALPSRGPVSAARGPAAEPGTNRPQGTAYPGIES